MQIVLSAVFALIYVVLVGYLTVRVEAREQGGVLDAVNTLVRVTDPGSPWLLQLALASITVLLAFWFLWSIRHGRRLPAAAGLAVLVLCAGWFAFATEYPQASLIVVSSESPLLEWARAGTLSAAVHTLGAVLVAAIALSLTASTVRGRGVRSTD